MHLLYILPLVLNLASASIIIPADREACHLNLTLAGSGTSQYWVLTDAIFPPLVSRTTLASSSDIFSILSLDTSCDRGNRAPELDWMALVNALSVDSGAIQRKPRHIQYRGCYVSWHTPMSGHVTTLFPYARDIFFNCGVRDGVSGAHRNEAALRNMYVESVIGKKYC